MEIGDALRRFRNEFKLTQKQVALKAGIPVPQQWQKYEYKQMIPSAEIIAKVAVAFGVSADYLLGISNEPHPAQPKSDDGELVNTLIAYQKALSTALKNRGIEI